MELVNPRYGDRYFSADDGLAEAIHVFVRGNNLAERARTSPRLRVAETGFGTGLNLMASCLAISRDPVAGQIACSLAWTSVEEAPLPGPVIAGTLGLFSDLDGLSEGFLKAWPEDGGLAPGWNRFDFLAGPVRVGLRVWSGDVLAMLEAVAAGPEADWPDCWVLDGHSPALNPAMWSPAVFRGMAACSRLEPATGFATYTAAGQVKAGLRAAGFFVRRQAGFGRKRHMINGFYAGSSDQKNV